MSTSRNQSTPGFRLNTASGGIIIIGRDDSDIRVAGKPDGSVFVGSADRPYFARNAQGDVMLSLSDDFVSHVFADGEMRVHGGDNSITFRPVGDLMVYSSEDDGTSSEIMMRLKLMASEMLGEEMAISTAGKSAGVSDPLSLTTTRAGSARISQGNTPTAVIGRRDGAVYVGSKKEQIMGRLATGEILLCIAPDYGVVIHPSGKTTICTLKDAIELNPGSSLVMSAGSDDFFAAKIHESLVELSEEIARPAPRKAPQHPPLKLVNPVDEAPVPAYPAAPQPASEMPEPMLAGKSRITDASGFPDDIFALRPAANG